jgi:hypothetical protein
MDNFMDEKKFIEKIFIKAIKDVSFRNELKKNPRKVMERELGTKLPLSVSWEVLEQTENKRYILLPVISEVKDLSDLELAKIGGAGTPRCKSVVYCRR